MKKCKQDSDLNIVSMPVVGRGKSVMNLTPEQRISAIGGYRLKELGLFSLVVSPSSFFCGKLQQIPVNYPCIPSSRLAEKCIKPE